MPCSPNTRAMKRACATLTQKPSARIEDSSTRATSCWITRRAQTSLPVTSFVEPLDVVAATAAPRHVAQIEAVVDAVVDERREALLVDRVPEPQLGRDAPAEPLEHGQAVGCARESPSDRAAPRVGGARAARRYVLAAAWWNSSTTTTSKCSGSSASRPDALRLWIDAKTCSNRSGRAPPTQSSPNDASRRPCRKSRRLCVRISSRCATKRRRARGSASRRRA
jgi:hypothetical protein